MERKLKLGEIMGIGAYIGNNEDLFDGLEMNAKSIYNTLKLKKTVAEKFATGQETITQLAKSFGATTVENGLQVPPEKLEDFNKDYNELMNEEVLISYDPIEISATAQGSSKFMEAFFDFIVITD